MSWISRSNKETVAYAENLGKFRYSLQNWNIMHKFHFEHQNYLCLIFDQSNSIRGSKMKISFKGPNIFHVARLVKHWQRVFFKHWTCSIENYQCFRASNFNQRRLTIYNKNYTIIYYNCLVFAKVRLCSLYTYLWTWRFSLNSLVDSLILLDSKQPPTFVRKWVSGAIDDMYSLSPAKTGAT